MSRATIANWVIQCSQTWLKPLYRPMKQELLTNSVIHANETVVQVLGPHQKKMAGSHAGRSHSEKQQGCHWIQLLQ